MKDYDAFYAESIDIDEEMFAKLQSVTGEEQEKARKEDIIQKRIEMRMQLKKYKERILKGDVLDKEVNELERQMTNRYHLLESDKKRLRNILQASSASDDHLTQSEERELEQVTVPLSFSEKVEHL